jgi:hypothetical protein
LCEPSSELSRRRDCVAHVVFKMELSERRACALVGQPRSTQRQRPMIRDDEKPLPVAIVRLATTMAGMVTFECARWGATRRMTAPGLLCGERSGGDFDPGRKCLGAGGAMVNGGEIFCGESGRDWRLDRGWIETSGCVAVI